jgi:hypothetical protein
VGVPLGCVAGIAVTVAAARPLGIAATAGVHSALYFAVFVAFTAWALVRGAPRSAIELLPATAAALLLIPISSLLYRQEFPITVPLVDAMAVVATVFISFAWRAAMRRSQSDPRDSVWATGAGAPDERGALAESTGP